MIFTDGHANEGITDMEKLRGAALEYRAGIGISSFGYGRDHNEKLLHGISQDGEFYFIDSPDKILTAFGAELGGLISTYAQNVVLTLTPAEGVEIVEVLNDLNVKDADGKVVVECDDLLAEQEYAVVIRAKVAKRDNAHPRAVTLVKGEVSYLDVAEAKKVTTKVALKVKFVVSGKEDTKDDPKVMDEVALQMAVAAQNQAIKLADQGDFLGSRGVLHDAAAVLRGLGTVKSANLAAVQDGLASDNFGSQAVYLAGGSSEVRSMTKGLSRRRMASSGQKGGVQMDAMYGTNKAQENMVAAFTGADASQDAPVTPGDLHSVLMGMSDSGDSGDADPKDSGPKSVSKSRSGRW